MQSRKPYKTKLCELYERGRCNRVTCSYAHGYAELRHYSGPSFVPGRRDYNSGGNEVRERFQRERKYSREPSRRFSPQRERKYSREPSRRFSPQRDYSRDRDSPYNNRNFSPDRGSSLSRSPIRERRQNNERGSGSFNSSRSNSLEEGETKKKETKNPTSQNDDRENLLNEIKQLEIYIDSLNDDKYDLELLLEDKSDEEEKLLNKIEDLELQIAKEQQESKRINSKLRKFVKAHTRYMKAQEELKRSQERLQRLGFILGPEIPKNEEDSSENVANGNGNFHKSPLNNNYNNNDTSSIKKRVFSHQDTSEEVKEESTRKREKHNEVVNISERHNKSENIISKLGSIKCSNSDEINSVKGRDSEGRERKLASTRLVNKELGNNKNNNFNKTDKGRKDDNTERMESEMIDSNNKAEIGV